ncbi:MAG: DUF1631 domain-containing protein, partial [Gammaproteobacteria bacterium]|nr:DUF1631 domain-containing protein [Gammaproteobacteria bacterium]
QTDAWGRTIMIIDTLLWSLGVPTDPVKREKLREIFPALKRRIEKGLASVSDYYEPEAQALFDLLLSFQQEEVEQEEEEAKVVVVADQEVIATQEAEVDQEVIATQEAEVDQVSTATQEAEVDQVSAATQETEVDRESAATQEVVENQELPQLEEVAARMEAYPEDDMDEEMKVDDEPLTPDEGAMALRLRNTEFGTWFQFPDDATGRPVKAKLSWFSPLSKRYMFVDRNGVQIAVKPFNTLVREMSDKTAKTIDPPSVSFFNLAMQSIKVMLERATAPVKTKTSRQ